jgi:transcriptional regulator NrdR family protein
MNCPRCSAEAVVTRKYFDGDGPPRRLRKCLSCEYEFETVEIPRDVYQSVKFGSLLWGLLKDGKIPR